MRLIAKLILILTLVVFPQSFQAAATPEPNIGVNGYYANNKAQRGRTVQAAIVMDIPGGYHVNANPATFPYLIATEVTAGASEGVSAGKPTYPGGERKKFQFAIVLKSEERLIGNCGIRKQNAYIQVADLGYEVDRRYWGHGYATEASRALLDFGFKQLGLHRIWAYCLEENVASARVLEKVGMRYEGRQRESEWMKNRWWNTLHYAMLDHEWRRMQSR